MRSTISGDVIKEQCAASSYPRAGMAVASSPEPSLAGDDPFGGSLAGDDFPISDFPQSSSNRPMIDLRGGITYFASKIFDKIK